MNMRVESSRTVRELRGARLRYRGLWLRAASLWEPTDKEGFSELLHGLRLLGVSRVSVCHVLQCSPATLGRWILGDSFPTSLIQRRTIILLVSRMVQEEYADTEVDHVPKR